MDSARFDSFVRWFSARASRRTLLGLAALGLTALLPRAMEARKRRRRRKRKKKTRPRVVLNAFGCVDVGNACRGDSTLCCSGICEGEKPKKGKKDRSRCAGHDEGGCQPSDDRCRFGRVNCGPEGTDTCFLTTGGAGYCASGGPFCAPCQKDVDCEPDFGPGAACIVCEVFCGEPGTACSVTGG